MLKKLQTISENKTEVGLKSTDSKQMNVGVFCLPFAFRAVEVQSAVAASPSQ